MQQNFSRKRKQNEDLDGGYKSSEEEVDVSDAESGSDHQLLNKVVKGANYEEEDGSSDSNDDQEDDYDPNFSRHSAETESFPPCPAYHPAFKRAQEIYRWLFDHFPREQVLSLKQSRLELLCSEVEKLSPIPEPEPLKIALLGEAGKGKSSLLNSLLDNMKLAKTVGSFGLGFLTY